jgi:hypothetical protein
MTIPKLARKDRLRVAALRIIRLAKRRNISPSGQPFDHLDLLEAGRHRAEGEVFRRNGPAAAFPVNGGNGRLLSGGTGVVQPANSATERLESSNRACNAPVSNDRRTMI